MWGHGEHEKTERWDGAFETREAAIEDGRKHYQHGPAQAFWIQAGALCSATAFVPDAAEIIERMNEAANDEAGEVAEEYPDVTEEAKAEMDAFLSAWAEKHAAPRFWVGVGEPEKIEPLPLAVFYEPDAEEWVIAYSETDATEVYKEMGGELLDEGMHWQRLDDSKVLNMDDAPEGTESKTCAQWCASNGRSYLGSGNY